jgi:hypothetical protein
MVTVINLSDASPSCHVNVPLALVKFGCPVPDDRLTTP